MLHDVRNIFCYYYSFSRCLVEYGDILQFMMDHIVKIP